MKTTLFTSLLALVVIGTSCQKDKDCTTEQQTYDTSIARYSSFCDSIGTSSSSATYEIVQTINDSATYMGSGYWKVQSNGVTVYVETYTSIIQKWDDLNFKRNTNYTILQNCLQ